MDAHVGSAAPIVEIGGFGQRSPWVTELGRPWVLAFAPTWSPVRAPSTDLAVIRAHLRGIGASLVVLSNEGVWWLRPDDEAELARNADDLAGDFAKLSAAYGVPPDREAVFVIDASGMIRYASSGDALSSTLIAALATAERTLHAAPTLVLDRRDWIVTSLCTSLALFVVGGCKEGRRPPPPPARPVDKLAITLRVNGLVHSLEIDPRMSLLDALRERLGLTGTKKGCDAGQCGACTVHINGRRFNSCLMLAVSAQGTDITTIEGIGSKSKLHPVQAAFIEHDGFQCGYCTPGQIMSAVALLAENRANTPDQIREHMSGNLCRCGAYPNIVAAIVAAKREPA
jgi:xanthine dehydrogenase YagT iron-sulfur-binding subunit